MDEKYNGKNLGPGHYAGRMALHNDPAIRHRKYRQAGRQAGMKDKTSPGGSPRPAANYTKTKARGDGTAPAIAPGGSRMPASKIGSDGTFSRADLHCGVNPAEGSGTSIFDPVLCELVYRWFSPPGGQVLDPFAGGSVRGIVAHKLGRKYLGVELRKEQVEANEAQGMVLCPDSLPVWKCGDSSALKEHIGELRADLVFSCPPYADLEIYSDDPRDISNMAYSRFLQTYTSIIKQSVEALKQDRFAVFVVGEVREKKGGGYYRGFVPDTIEAFEKAGARFYNEAILVTAVGSLPIRSARMFESGRKLGKTHQNVLVFCKGNPKQATENCGAVDITEALNSRTTEVQ